MHVVGTYECKLILREGKASVSITKQLKGVETFVLKFGISKCLELYTLEEWSTMMEKVNKLNRFRKEQRLHSPIYCYRV